MSRTDARGQLNGRRAWYIAALIFLCNPNLHALDLFPDFIGYALLLRGLRRTARADESFGRGASLLRRLAYLSLARLIGLFWITLATGADDRPVLLLTLSFALGVLELMAVFPACRELFGGLSYLGMRMGGRIIFEPCGKGSTKDITDRACLRCQVFAVGKAALCVLPELAALSDASFRQGVIAVHWYRYIGMFRFVALLAGVALGVWWLLGMVRYLLRIEGDTSLWQALLEYCRADELAHPERLPARRLKAMRVLTVLGCVFCIQLYINSVHMLPSFVAPLLWLAALLCIRSYIPTGLTRAAGGCFGLHAVVSGVSYAVSGQFFLSHDLSALYRSERVYTAYRAVCTLSVLEAAFLALSVVMQALVLCALIRRYTGAHAAAAHAMTKQQMLTLRKIHLRRRLLIVGVLGVLCGAAHAAYYYLLPRYDFVWMLDVLVALLLVLFATLRLSELCGELDTGRMAEHHPDPASRSS